MKSNHLVLIIIYSFLILLVCCADKKNDKVEKISSLNSDSVNAKNKNSMAADFKQNVQGEYVFIYKINPSLPDFKFVVYKDSFNFFITDLKIYQINDTIEKQHIKLEGDSYWGMEGEREYFLVQDFNFDGYKDIMIMNWFGSGGESYQVWIYDPKKNIFSTKDFFLNLSNPSINYAKRELTLYDRAGQGENNTRIYKFYANKYHLIKEERNWTEHDEDKTYYVQDISKRMNGKMKLVSRKKKLIKFY